MNINDFEDQLKKEYRKIKRETKKPHILVTGGTGVGKSSLINLCFGKNVAEAGVGRPITKKITSFRHPEIPIVLFDTNGYEINNDNFIKNILKKIKEDISDSRNQIHLIWYCISAPGSRITDFDLTNLYFLQETGIPTSVVFTKCELATDDDLLKLHSIIPESFKKFNITNKEEFSFFDLMQLLDWSLKNLSDGLKIAFIASQQVNLDIKRREALKVVSISASTSIIADPSIFQSRLIIMIAKILHIYQLYFLNNIAEMFARNAQLKSFQQENESNSLFGVLINIIPFTAIFKNWLGIGAKSANLMFLSGIAISDICYEINKLIIEDKVDEADNFLRNIESFMKNTVNESYLKSENELRAICQNNQPSTIMENL